MAAPVNLHHLPYEIWALIAWYLPRMPDQPRWQPWVKYRTLNSIFKKAIEQFYVEEWLEWTSLYVDCERRSHEDGRWGQSLQGEFTFRGFADAKTGRVALLQNASRSKRSVGLEREIWRQLSTINEWGYHPYLIMSVERGATDMLPMDLQMRLIDSHLYFFFDWRTYLCTLCDELRRIDELQDEDDGTPPVRPCTRLALDLWRKGDELITKEPEFMDKLMRAAGTALVGADGRLLEVRRNRRYRLGVKSGQLGRWEFGTSRILHDRFERLDEERVALKLLQMDDIPLEW